MEYVKYKPNMHIDNILSVLDYFDPQNFSPNVRCPVLVGIGALDHLAPPTTVYAMY
ncbi:acetylxylan esterase, partial [Acinetobacter baumannii]